MLLKRLSFSFFLIFIFNCSSGDGSSNGSDQINTSALSVGDSYPGFDDLNICANQDLNFDYDDTSTVILVSFFASWWGDCQAHVSSLEALHQQYRQQGLVIVSPGKDIGNPYTCDSWKSTFGASYIIANDNERIIEQQLSKDGTHPYHVLIDKSRTIRYSQTGYDQGALESLIQTTLNE